MKKPFLRLDSFVSAITGGNPFSGLKNPTMDRTVFNRSASFVTTLYADETLLDAYMTNGLAARVVDLPADDAAGGSFDITGDDGSVAGELKRLKWAAKCADAVRWARLYGASMMIIIADDAPHLELPLDINSVGQISDLRVIAGSRSMLSVGEYYEDPADPRYGQPKVYMIQQLAQRGTPYYVHESRTLQLGGLPVPGEVSRLSDLPWRGRSALQGPMKNILRYTNALEWTERMLERKQQPIIKYAGLAELIQETMDPTTGISSGQEQVKQRVNLADMTRSMLNSIALDADDDFDVKDLNLAGVPEVLNTYQISISADSGLPVTTLFGRSPAGHNATGASDQENYYKLCGRIQTNDIEPMLLRLIPIIGTQRTFAGKIQPKYNIDFQPLWLPTDFEQAKANNENATADFNRAQALSLLVAGAAVISSDEAAAYLAQSGQYGLTPEMLLNRDTPTTEGLDEPVDQ